MNVFYRYRFISLCNSNQETLLPVVQIDSAILESFLRYQIKFKNKGKTWHRDSASAIVLLLEFYFATKKDYANPKQMFEGFSDAVRYGTVNLDQSDETELRWEPKSPERSNTLIHRLTAYSDWLYHDTDDESALLNPIREATKAERVINLAAYHHKKNNSFLKHTYDDAKAKKKSKKSRSIIKHEEPKKTDVAYKFPKEHFWDLIDIGFIRHGSRSGDPIHKRLNLANVLITLLLRFTGIRVSEAFHIYSFEDDITVDPMSPPDEPRVLVKIHHPELGLAPESWRKKYNKPTATRKEYLKIHYGMLPRNDKASPKCLYAGWKDPALLSGKKFMIANFYDFQAARLFLIYWRLYLKHQIPKNKTHPFAFSNKNGDPLSYKAFRDSYQIGIEKIGLAYMKSEGTTEHGHRHLYKAEVEVIGMEGHFVSHLLHHSNLDSKDAYGKYTQEEICKKLSVAQDKIADKFSVPALPLEDES